MASGRVSKVKGKVVDIPNAPTIGTATAGGESVSIAFTAYSGGAGGPTRSYIAKSNPGNITATGSTSPISVTGLTAGTSYTISVAGVNETGTGEYSSASGSAVPLDLTAYSSIATSVVGSGGSSEIEFASIPNTYEHLQIRIMAKLTDTANQGGYAGIRLNSDASSSNYTFHRLKGEGSSASNYGVGTGTYDWIVNERIASSHSNIATEEQGILVVDILDYKNTNKYTTIKTLGGYDSNGTGEVILNSALWLNTAAITNIKILPSAGNFAQYSHFALYGIRGS